MGEPIANPEKPGHRWTATAVAAFGAALGATVLFDRLWLRRNTSVETQQGVHGSRTGRGTPGKGPSQRSREAGYETTDANVRSLVIVMVSALTLMVGGVTGVFFMFAHFDRGSQAPDTTLTAVQRAPIEPPLPHLQASPYQDIDAVLVEQNSRLTSYGWNGPDHVSGHIPIGRAMQQLVGKSLDPSAQADASGVADTGQRFPSGPAVNALDPQDRPANRVQGEGRPDTVVPRAQPEAIPR